MFKKPSPNHQDWVSCNSAQQVTLVTLFDLTQDFQTL